VGTWIARLVGGRPVWKSHGGFPLTHSSSIVGCASFPPHSEDDILLGLSFLDQFRCVLSSAECLVPEISHSCWMIPSDLFIMHLND
jgi:hypothetical protein